MAPLVSKTFPESFGARKETLRLRRVVFRLTFELPQELPLAPRKVHRRFDRYLNIHVAELPRPQHRHAFSAEPELLPGLRAFRHRHPRFLSLDRRDFDFAAERRPSHGNRHAAEKIGPVALKELVWFDGQENVEVARRPASKSGFAFAGEPDARPVLHSRRDVHRQCPFFGNAPGAVAIAAGIRNDLAAPLARLAGALHREEPRRLPDRAGALTCGAGLGR